MTSRGRTCGIIAPSAGSDKAVADVLALLWNVVVIDVLSNSEAGNGAEKGELLEEHFARSGY